AAYRSSVALRGPVVWPLREDKGGHDAGRAAALPSFERRALAAIIHVEVALPSIPFSSGCDRERPDKEDGQFAGIGQDAHDAGSTIAFLGRSVRRRARRLIWEWG